MNKLKKYCRRIVGPRWKRQFLKVYADGENIHILDVGCGNNSASAVRDVSPNCYYVGIDVGDYNIDADTKAKMNEYHVVPAEAFADRIGEFKESMDIVISSHNIEHCNEPHKVLKNMILSLKPGGHIYLAFPSEKSISFPKRKGTLNFYDDDTHIWLPRWDDIIKILEECDIKIIYKSKNYRPLRFRIIGRLNEKKSKAENRVLNGTWAYYGFESIIWGKKLSEDKIV